jgi:hypothetical protein
MAMFSDEAGPVDPFKKEHVVKCRKQDIPDKPNSKFIP